MVPDYPRLFAGLNALLDKINAGDGGLPALYRLLELGQEALGAEAMSFVEYAPSGGRVIAATGASYWAVGRPVDTTDPAIAQLLAGPRTQERPISDLPEELAAQYHGRGLSRMVGARAELGGLVVGSLHAYFPETGIRATDAERSLVTWLASSAARMYGERTGLPVHDDGHVVASLADGLAILGRDGSIRLWNPAAERVTGFPTSQMLGAHLPLPVPDPGQSVDHRLPDGRWLQVHCAELAGSDARVVTFRDITETRRRERDRDLFIAVTSHELRTPVTVIKGYADTLGEHWDQLSDAERRDAVRVLGQRSADLARLVDRLLSAASNAGGALGELTPIPFDLVDALRAAADRLPSDLRKGLRVELPRTLPKAYGDRGSVATLLTELLTNAYKYSPTGADVQLDAEADGQTVYFRVSDRGIGVRPEHVERAFERFWQGELDDQRRYSGVGLGLYLVRRLVERQNGWVSLRPRERGGTVAEVRLPRADATSSGSELS
ncbi:MAG TPA: ATP-binding protein [Micromonosporaceae bacterium]|nr:ATP-binding protein [Micromonosporaceae bacterium]